MNILLLLIAPVPFFLEHKSALIYSPYNYFFNQSLLFFILFSFKGYRRNQFLLSPSFIAVTYLNLNFLIGSIIYSNGQVYPHLFQSYIKWDNGGNVIGYFNLANFLIISSFYFSGKIRFYKGQYLFDFKKLSKKKIIFCWLYANNHFFIY